MASWLVNFDSKSLFYNTLKEQWELYQDKNT